MTSIETLQANVQDDAAKDRPMPVAKMNARPFSS